MLCQLQSEVSGEKILCHQSYVQCHGLQKNSNNNADVDEESLHAVTETEL